MAAIDTIKQIVDDNGTIYRVRPNPDGEPGGKSGLVLEWSEDGKEWNGYFFIGPEVCRLVGQALMDLA